MTVKVYLAGKISDPIRASWRAGLLEGGVSAYQSARHDAEIDSKARNSAGGPMPWVLEWDTHPNNQVLGKYDYVGPYLIDCRPWKMYTDSGHMPPVPEPKEYDREISADEHGSIGYGQHGDWFGWTGMHSGSGRGSNLIGRQCMEAVKRCDVLFAYLDGTDLNGTMIEIGWAMAWNKTISVVVDSEWSPDCENNLGDLLSRSVPNEVWSEGDGVNGRTRETFLVEALKRAIERHEVHALATMPYADYLKTEHWQKVRAEAVRRADGHCQICASTVQLDVHHNTYERRGKERAADIIALCRPCHALFHGKLEKAAR